MSEGYVMLYGYMDMDGVTSGQSPASLISTCCIVIARRFLLSLLTLSGPHPLLFAHSECHWSCLHVSCEEARRDVLMHGSSYMF